MAAITQLGGKVIVGFKGNTYEVFQMESAGEKATGEEAVIRDDAAATATVLISDTGKEVTLEGTIKNVDDDDAELDELKLLKKGDALEVNTVYYCVEEVNLKFQRLQATGSITLMKEDSMDYTPAP